MAGKRTYQFTILAKIDEAKKSVDEFSKGTQERLDKLNFRTAVTSIQSGISIAQNLAGAIQNAFGYAVNQALEAEANVRKLNNAMRISGEYSEYASVRMQEYAAALAEATVHSQDQVLSAINIAKTYGLVNSEARAVTKAAADLAAVTDGDLNGAVRDLALTFNGFISKELIRIEPKLKGLTKDQLAAGEAVRIFSERLKGSAADALNSYAGDLAKARKTVDDFYQTIGNYALKATAFLIRDTYALGRNIKQFAVDVAKASLNAKGEAEVFGTIFDQASRASRKAYQDGIETAKEAAAARKAVQDRVRENQAEGARQELQAIKGQLQSIRLASLNEVERINADFADKANTVAKAFAGKLIKTEKEKNEILAGLDAQRLKQVEAAQDALLAKQAAKVQRFSTDFANAIEEAYRKGNKISNEEGVGLAAGIANAALKGIEGARQLVGGIAGAVANYFIPGIGGVVNQIVQELSKGPDYVVKMVREFREAIPQLVENIFTSIPALLESIAEDTPRIVDKIIEMLPRVMDAFVKGIPRFFSAMIEAVPQLIASLARAMPSLIVAAAKGFVDFFIKGFPLVVKALIEAIVEGVPEIIEGFYKGIVGAAEGFVDALFEALKSIGGIFGGGSGGGGFLGGGDNGLINEEEALGIDIPFLAKGGRVPSLAQFKGDRYPAMLDAGEQVFRGDLSDRLERFLDSNGEGGRPLVLQVVMDRKVIAEATYKNRKAGYRQ